MCLHGQSEVKEKKAGFRCRRCGALTKKKGRVCKPEKIKDGKKKIKDKEKKKGKMKKSGKSGKSGKKSK